MAEGWLKHLRGDDFAVYSAGLRAHGLNPLAVKCMQEAGVDISEQQSQTIDEIPITDIDYMISVCSHADKTCPVLPARVKRTHVPFDDPPQLAADAETEADALPHYRRVRDEIRQFIESIDKSLE